MGTGQQQTTRQSTSQSTRMTWISTPSQRESSPKMVLHERYLALPMLQHNDAHRFTLRNDPANSSNGMRTVFCMRSWMTGFHLRGKNVVNRTIAGFRSTRRTKIIATIGPATCSEEMLEIMAVNGMNVARLNMSHGTHEWHSSVIERIRKLNKTKGCVLLSTLYV